MKFYFHRSRRLFLKPRTIAVTACLVFCFLFVVFYYSNVSEIFLYYLFSGPSLRLSILCNLGRLGNQMCTYATLYGLSALNNRRPFVSLSCNLNQLRPYFQGLTANSTPSLLYIPWNSWKVSSYLKAGDVSIPPNSNFINGYKYPCSYTFFHHVRDELRREFRFSEQVQHFVHHVLLKANVHHLKNLTYVGMHVRRGDYMDAWLKHYDGVPVNFEYFQKAVEYFRSKYSPVVFVMVSDDRLWCISHLAARLGVYVAEESPTPVHDLALLANCNHSVITYGTFGFWGAYLGDGEVVYFDRYLHPNSTFAKDAFIWEKMYPPLWKGLVTTNFSNFRI